MKLSDAFKVLWERIKGIQAGTVKQETIADLYGNNAPKGKLSEIREARKERLAKKREQSQRPPRADAAPPPTQKPLPRPVKRCGRFTPSKKFTRSEYPPCDRYGYVVQE